MRSAKIPVESMELDMLADIVKTSHFCASYGVCTVSDFDNFAVTFCQRSPQCSYTKFV